MDPQGGHVTKPPAYRAVDFRRDILLPDAPDAGASVCADGRIFKIATCTEIDGEWLSLVYLPV